MKYISFEHLKIALSEASMFGAVYITMETYIAPFNVTTSFIRGVNITSYSSKDQYSIRDGTHGRLDS